jgi:hypothetical protein
MVFLTILIESKVTYMKLQIEIKRATKCGLEVFKVFVNDVYSSEFVSLSGARVFVLTKFPNAQWK